MDTRENLQAEETEETRNSVPEETGDEQAQTQATEGQQQAEAAQGGQEQPSEPSWEEKYRRLEADYKRLERKLTRVSQRLAEAEEAVNTLHWIQERPDLAEQIQALIDSYAGAGGGYVQQPQVDLAQVQHQMAEAMKYLLSRPDFVAHEQEIRDFAEEEGYDPDDPVQLRQAYRLWRGENAERLAQEQALKLQQRAQKKQEARQKAALQGSGGPGAAPPPDFRKMSPEEVLAHLGLPLHVEE